MSHKSCQFLEKESLYENDQDFLDTQCIDLDVLFSLLHPNCLFKRINLHGHLKPKRNMIVKLNKALYETKKMECLRYRTMTRPTSTT